MSILDSFQQWQRTNGTGNRVGDLVRWRDDSHAFHERVRAKCKPLVEVMPGVWTRVYGEDRVGRRPDTRRFN